MKIIRNCQLIPALSGGGAPPKADLVIDGGKIADVLPAGGGTCADAEIIEAEGMFALPGLIDLHTHLCMMSQDYAAALLEEPYDAAFTCYSYAKEYLKQGYTTVRDMGTNDYGAIGARNGINSGVAPGPRIIASGRIITPTETGNKCFAKMYHEADGADGLAKAARQELQMGADFIKLMGTGAFYNDGGIPGATIVTEKELQSVVETASMHRTYVAMHAHGTHSIALGIRCGVRTIEHASLIDDATIELASKSKDTFLVLTTSVDKLPYDEPEQIPSHMWDKINTLTAKSHAQLKKCYKAGLKLGWGTDIDLGNIRKRVGYEFEARTEMLGFAPLELLKQATVYSAEIAGINNVTGSIEKGKCADIILVQGDPRQDIGVMKKLPKLVMARGKAFDPQTL